MGFITTDLAIVPRGDAFKWYIFLLEDSWDDDLRSELSENFDNLAREIGQQALAVRGSYPDIFSEQVINEYLIERQTTETPLVPRPALLITDEPPHEDKRDHFKREAKMILLPLSEQYRRPGSITDILKEVARAVRDPEAFQSLQNLDPGRLERHWGWLSHYFIIKPSFFGFGIDLNAVIEDLFFRNRRQ